MSKNLLIVDDAQIIREMIKDAAVAEGWRVLGEAVHGKEAVEQYMRLQPDVVTLDLVMPQFDGLYALRGILEFDPAATIIVVSALDQKEILKEAFHIGAADFVVKPFQKQILVDTLHQQFTNRSKLGRF